MNKLPQAFAGGTQYRVPRENSRWPALALAAAMHAGLFFFLWIGVRWQNTEPVAVEAEVWDMKTQAAAPPAPAPAPAPEPETAQEAPPPAPAPRAAMAEPVAPPPAPKLPDIALERRKAKLKAEEIRRKELQQEQEQAQAQAQAQADEAATARLRAKAEARAKEKAKALADDRARQQKDLADARAKQELIDKKLADKLAEKLAEKLADKKLADKLLADKLAQAKKAAQQKARTAEEQKAVDKLHDAEMRKLTDAAGSGGFGTAAKSSAPRSDGAYAAAIRNKIKSNIAYSGSTDVAGNPRAIFKIDQLPNGEIISVKKVKSSGIAAYDNAVENAINKSSPLPRKKDGTVDRELEAVFDMKDLP